MQKLSEDFKAFKVRNELNIDKIVKQQPNIENNICKIEETIS